MRKTAAQALGDIGHTQAVEPLYSALEDKAESVRKATAQAL